MKSILRTMLDDANTTLDKSSFAPVHRALIERYLELMKEKKFSEDEKQVETFIEWVHGSIAEVERTSLHEPLKVVEEP